MEVQTIILSDIDNQLEKAEFNYAMDVQDRKMYDFNYRGDKLTFIRFKDILPINPSNNASMLAMGLRSHHVIIDRELFKKTDNEKERLKRMKSNIKSFIKGDSTKLNSQKVCQELFDNFTFYDTKKRVTGLAKNISNFKATNLEISKNIKK